MTGPAGESPLACFEVEVRAVHRMSPTFARVTFGGDCLAGFDDGGPLGPRDQRVKLVVPLAGGAAPPLRDLSPGWYPRWLARDPALRGEMRTYTVRAVRGSGTGTEVDVDFVLHGATGPASAWACAAERGDRVTLLGPRRGRREEYAGIEWAPPAPGAGPLLLVGDETAVPAIASVLATLPAGYDGRAVLEVPAPADFLDVRTDADVAVTWLARGTHARGELLAEAVRAVAPARGSRPVADVDPDEVLWEPAVGGRPTGAPYVWVAGEAAVVRGLRRHLVGAAGLPRSAVTFMGYWRETPAERPGSALRAASGQASG
ncbi:siderophore-interacting protein [Nocardioides panacis]|uniref:Siderophore-interacting protein n=1 Tax=Nocardioides panacis TaxID=2849501 RepID=A0A975SW76_9ACTN|nr:siderophore-interacting protein [Nocardioides panacis]QWZ07049.1 siderophore-interacting protein [Nocardioides panacis]